MTQGQERTLNTLTEKRKNKRLNPKERNTLNTLRELYETEEETRMVKVGAR